MGDTLKDHPPFKTFILRYLRPNITILANTYTYYEDVQCVTINRYKPNAANVCGSLY